jgi:C4-dicarboxylate transporter DctM subunit
MSPVSIGLIGIVILFFAFLMGMPIAFSMMSVGLLGMLLLVPAPAALNFLAMDVFDRFTDFAMTAITMFILMGYYASMSGITTRLYDVAYSWIGHLRGGLSIATVLANAGFACVTGSSAAAVATMGKVAYPEMKRYGYDDKLSTGVIASAGVLGPMIPPSTGMIVYGLLTEQSIGRLFISGILPGIMITGLFALTVFILCKRDPNLGPPGPSTTWAQKLKSLPGLIETGGLFLLVIGGMFAGWFTPNQAGAVGTAGALIICLIRRSFSWRALWNATRDSLLVACMVLFLITGAIVFGHFLSVSTLTLNLINWVKNLAVDPLVILVIVCLFYIVGGCVVDAMGLFVLTIPIVTPVIFELGYDPIWFGVVLGVLGETGVITPPVGVNVFVLKAIIPELNMYTIFKGIVPFFIAIIVALVLVISFPPIALFLPNLMMGA